MTTESSQDPTICGVATGTPDGGVAIVRISGPEANKIGRTLVGSLPAPRVLAMRRFVVAGGRAECGEEALVVWMPGPRSYTGEDVVELHVHGGERNVGSVVAAVLELGAQAAGPGDFTRRAFQRGRLDLAQAEGIAAVIGAQTEAALAQARRLVAGELGREVEVVRERIERLRVEVEANLDFPEDVAGEDVQRWGREVDEVVAEVQGWLSRFEVGRRGRERARVVVAGPPNAGKSSLFNRLLGKERTLVSAQAGTTRDYVEAEWAVGPFAALLVDTAGLRRSEETVEAGGIARTEEQLAGADVVIWVEGADQEAEGERFNVGTGTLVASGREAGVVIRVENKSDLGRRRPTWCGVSATTGAGIDAVVAEVQAWFRGSGDEPWIGLARHRDRAVEAVNALARAAGELDKGDETLELVAFQLAVAARRLGEVTGRHSLGPVGADVLDQIFARFCIGK